MNYSTLKRIAALLTIASSNPTRKNLNCVMLMCNKDTVELMSADGFLVSKEAVCDEELCDMLEPNKEYVIQKKSEPAVNALIKLNKKTKTNFNLNKTGSEIIVSNSSDFMVISFKIQENDLIYPDLDRIVKDNIKNPISIGINARLLNNLVQAIADDYKKDATIKITISNDETKKIMVECSDISNRKGVVMPVKIIGGK